MGAKSTVLVRLPLDLAEAIDAVHANRDAFVTRAVQKELCEIWKDILGESLAYPHPDSMELSEQGFSEWADQLPQDDPGDLLSLESGTPVKWVEGTGWVESAL